MDPNQAQLQVYEVGPTTVIGFGGDDVLDDLNVIVYRDAIEELITNNDIEVLAVDLTGVRLIPSGLLGLLASTRRHGVEVHIYNPSEDVREVLSVTNLDKVMPIHEVSVERSAGA
jgi:anti-anti-sigma factor